MNSICQNKGDTKETGILETKIQLQYTRQTKIHTHTIPLVLSSVLSPLLFFFLKKITKQGDLFILSFPFGLPLNEPAADCCVSHKKYPFESIECVAALSFLPLDTVEKWNKKSTTQNKQQDTLFLSRYFKKIICPG